MPDFRISVQHIFIVSTRTILHSTNSYMMLAKVLIIVKQIKDWLNGLQIKIPDSEAVRLGAEFPKPGWRHPQERDPNPQADGILGCRNVLHLVVRSFRRFTCKYRFFLQVVLSIRTTLLHYLPTFYKNINSKVFIPFDFVAYTMFGFFFHRWHLPRTCWATRTTFLILRRRSFHSPSSTSSGSRSACCPWWSWTW